MKLLRFGPMGGEKPGLLDSSGAIRDLSAHLPDWTGATLDPATLARIAALPVESLPVVPPGTRLGAPVGNVGNFIAVGLNFADHAAESGMATPSEPILFNKARNCIVGPNDDVILPRDSTKPDWEVELALVIGSSARYVSEADALKHIAGYCICNDVSERAFQIEHNGQWMKGKGCETFGPLGPWLVTPDEIADVQALDMRLDIDGERMQTGSTATMIFSVAFLVSYISRFMVLDPGDVITTGTPPGVGMGKKPPRFLKAGETMSLAISGLGEQRQKVVAFR